MTDAKHSNTRTSTSLPNDVVFTATDRFGVTVYLRKKTVDRANIDHSQPRARELQDFDLNRSTIENPEAIAPHAYSTDKRIYWGKGRNPDDPSHAPVHRLLVTEFDAVTSTAKMITAYDMQRTKRPTSMGTPIYDTTKLPGKD